MPATVAKYYRHPLRGDTDAALNFAAKYVVAVEDQIDNIEKAEMEGLEKFLNQYLPDPEDIRGFENETRRQIEDQIIPTVRYSMIVFCHTTFETQIVRVCDAVKEKENLGIRVSDLKGGEIERARKYLVKLAGLPINDFPEWQRLTDFQKVRDCIIHRNGYVTNSGDVVRLRQLPELYSGIEIRGERIYAEIQFCGLFADTLRSFFDALFNALGWRSGFYSRQGGQPEPTEEEIVAQLKALAESGKGVILI